MSGALVLGAAACATSAEVPPPTTGSGGSAAGGAGGAGGAVTSGAGGEAPRLVPQRCPDDTFAVGLDGDGMLTCAPLDVDVAAGVRSGCELYAGWRDGCNGCTAGPSKVGRTGGHACQNVAGADNTCIDATLGAETVSLFGLNTDGDVDNNDMFYLGWHCALAGETALAGPCEAGEHAVRVTVDGSVACMPTARLVADYVREHCSVFWGWRDGCSGCASPPSKWSRQRGVDCEVGAGADSVCGTPFVDGQWVTLAGVNTDGDVDDNDTFFVGLSCERGDATELASEDGCPFGTLLVGIDEDEAHVCASPSAAIAPGVRDGCRLQFGYRDGCGGCTTPPVKWGSVGTGSCQVGQGATCGDHDLGGTTVSLLGVRTDGDVDDNDKFYFGLTCN